MKFSKNTPLLLLGKNSGVRNVSIDSIIDILKNKKNYKQHALQGQRQESEFQENPLDFYHGWYQPGLCFMTMLAIVQQVSSNPSKPFLKFLYLRYVVDDKEKKQRLLFSYL